MHVESPKGSDLVRSAVDGAIALPTGHDIAMNCAAN